MWSKAFPFLLELDPEYTIIRTGKLMERICPEVLGRSFNEVFSITLRNGVPFGNGKIASETGRLLAIKRLQEPQRVFKGQWLEDTDTHILRFLGWPSIHSVRELSEWGLSLRDIPAHNPIIDSLILLETARGTVVDSQELANRLLEHSRTIEKANQLLDYQASHDPLTDLPNRRLLRERLGQAIDDCLQDNRRFALLFIDLDRFKNVNDSLGHSVGDLLLKEIADRLRKLLRPGDTVSREGGDEFLLLAMDILCQEDASQVAQKVLDELICDYQVNGHQLRFDASIGIALFPEHGNTPELLIRNADAAMFEAKATGRARYQFFSENTRIRIVSRFSLENELRSAVKSGEFELHFQPQIVLETGEIFGFEALLRWKHPHRGLMTPDDFVEIAEETGLIVPIGKWVLDEACKVARQWAIELGYPLRISVNVSARQFERGVLEDQVNSALSISGLPPDNLELELTESYVMREPEEAAKILSKLKDQGVRLALDDFGTGYANLRTLSILPFDTIKIDRGFLKAIPAHREGGAIVLSIIDLAKRLGITVVGEGVETIMQHDFLKNNGCSLGQGYLYAKPLTLKECGQQLGVRV